MRFKPLLFFVMFFLLVSSVNSWTPPDNINMFNFYGLFNATSINASKIYQNGFLVLTTNSTINANSSNTANTSNFWDGLDTPVNLTNLVLSNWENISSRFLFLSNFTDDLNHSLENVNSSLTANSCNLWDNLDSPFNLTNLVISSYENITGRPLFLSNLSNDIGAGQDKHTHDSENITNPIWLNLSGGTLSGPLNMSDNPILVDGVTLKVLDEKNTAIIGPAYGIYMTGPSGQNLPHFIIQSGGSSQASVLLRSMMIVNEISGFHNTTLATSCTSYMFNVSEELKIDCNTTTTGADLLVGDDMQVVGDVWVKDADGEWHFLTRTLSLLDTMYNDILFESLNNVLVGNVFNISSKDGTTLIVNLNRTETDIGNASDSIVLNNGTNSSPVHNFISYQNPNNPTLQISTTVPLIDYARVADILLGNVGTSYAALVDSFNVDDFVKGTTERFFNQGALYISGFNPAIPVSGDDLNISNGEMVIVLNKHSHSKNFSVGVDGYFVSFNDTTFIQNTSFSRITEYSDGNSISNGKYFNVVFGIVHNDVHSPRIMAIIQSKPTTEYSTLVKAEVDDANTLNVFPNDVFLKALFLPIARVVMQRSAGVNTAQTLDNGALFFDLRGTVGGAGGAAPSPSITSHPLLTDLDYASADHTGFLADDGSTPLTGNWAAVYNISANEFQGRFNWIIIPESSKWIFFNGTHLGFNESTKNSTDKDTTYTATGPWLELTSTAFSFNNTLANVTYQNDIGINCTAGQFVLGVENDGTLICAATAGSGDITAVTTDGPYLKGGVVSGDADLLLNESHMNTTFANLQSATFTGPVFAPTLNTGQGANELYTMNQDVQTSNAVVFATVNTGQGVNELYDMDQNVLTTSTPRFAGLNLSNQNLTNVDIFCRNPACTVFDYANATCGFSRSLTVLTEQC